MWTVLFVNFDNGDGSLCQLYGYMKSAAYAALFSWYVYILLHPQSVEVAVFIDCFDCLAVAENKACFRLVARL